MAFEPSKMAILSLMLPVPDIAEHDENSRQMPLATLLPTSISGLPLLIGYETTARVYVHATHRFVQHLDYLLDLL